MSTYTLVIAIDQEIFRLQSSDNFNIARKVNDRYTVTFSSASINPIGTQRPMGPQTAFSWKEEYAVFLSTSFDEGRQVSASTEFRNVSVGELCEYDSGILNPPVKADDHLLDGDEKHNSFMLKSVPQNLRASVACKSGERWMPIYVDDKQHNGVQNMLLTPSKEFAVFWDSRITGSTMIDYAEISRPLEFSFAPDETTKTIRFGYATPNAPSSVNEQPEWYMQ